MSTEVEAVAPVAQANGAAQPLELHEEYSASNDSETRSRSSSISSRDMDTPSPQLPANSTPVPNIPTSSTHLTDDIDHDINTPYRTPVKPRSATLTHRAIASAYRSTHHRTDSEAELMDSIRQAAAPSPLPRKPSPLNSPPANAMLAIYRRVSSTLTRIVEDNPEFALRRGLARTAAHAFLLGFLLALGLCVMVFSPSLRTFALWVSLQSLFHVLEFVMTAVFHPRDLSATSFLLNHSRAFNIAMVACVSEYVVEALLFPSLKNNGLTPLFFWVGLVLTLGGQAVRSLAMWTAGSNFTHLIAMQKTDEHRLVTDGIYKYSRHPSYAGWYWWCVGTQLLLSNPLCSAAYALVAWKFFDDRCRVEERMLFRFFGEAYRHYHDSVGIGIPFLRTPKL